LVNTDLIISKAAAIKKHLSRIEKKADVDLKAFLADIDIQEIVLFNLQMAIQNCIDIAAHIISDENLGVAASNNEMLYILEEHGYISPDLTEKMVKAIGFRNLIVHEYAKLDLRQVLQTAKTDIVDLSKFLKAIFHKTNITQ
jgi:uncharacterized protein YutE (UPF0331/DUF86 family)